MQYVALNQKETGKYLQLYAEVNLKKQKQKNYHPEKEKKISIRERNDYRKHHGNVLNYYFLGSEFELVRDHQLLQMASTDGK